MINIINKILIKKVNKHDAELEFWEIEIKNYINWYIGVIKQHYGTLSPGCDEKVKARTLKDSAILSWFNLHQKPKYLADLNLNKNAFVGKKVLDVGSGPYPSALAFDNIELYALDPLLSKYIEAGFPIHYYSNVKFVSSFAENMPFDDNFFDVVITLNAIDHVDDLEKTAMEIKRVLKPEGFFIAHVHYHKATTTEPIEITDDIFKQLFSWCKKLNKIHTSDIKHGSVCQDGESYTLWSNYHK